MFRFEQLQIYSKNVALTWYNNVDISQEFSYHDIINESKKITKSLREMCGSNILVGIILGHSSAIVPIIVGIANTNSAFCCINPTDSIARIKTLLDLYNCQIVICESSSNLALSLNDADNIETSIEVIILTISFKLFKLKKLEKISASLIEPEFKNIFFCASTSGTTGMPKIIKVPYECFMPNVISLSKYFQMTHDDRIFVSSPPTFDPFVLDLSLALYNGASLVMTQSSLRLTPEAIIPILFPLDDSQHKGITILQTTPSLFQRWSKSEIQNRIMCSKSKLRLLILGGEQFPSIQEVSTWQQWNQKDILLKRILNIYGVTEMSCWSTIYEITKNDILTRKTCVPLGQSIDEHTEISIVDSTSSKERIYEGIGELTLTSDVRKCYCNNIQSRNVATGDIVEIKNNEIFFKCRKDDVIKRYGNKCDLSKIERAIKEFSNIKNACCVYEKNTNKIVLFLLYREMGKSKTHLVKQFLKSKLLNHEVPDVIHFVDKFPLSGHGKILKQKLLETIEQKHTNTSLNLEKTFSEILNETLTIQITNSKQSKSVKKLKEMSSNLSFKQLGGSSFQALQILSELQTKTDLTFPKVMQMMLSDVSVKSIILMLKDDTRADTRSHTSDSFTLSHIIPSQFTTNWSINMHKCIDSSPTICHLSNGLDIISIGSHSHILINASCNDGSTISSLTLPDRIESSVEQYKDFGIVGCYNGCLYCFDIQTATIQWFYQSNGMIKCKAMVSNEHVVFGNYNEEHNVWCLNANTGKLCWKQKIGTKSIYSDPCKLSNEQILICTLDGHYASISVKSGEILWSRQCGSPIFSNPQIVPIKINAVLIAEVSGTVHLIDFDGNTLWNFKADGNIYSSFDFIQIENTMDIILVVFGCYDQKLYCVKANFVERNCDLIWKSAKMQAPIFVTPKFLSHRKQILSCSTNGHVILCDMNNGITVQEYRIDGEVFSTPAIWQNNLILGCRNNYLYSLML